MVRCLYCLAKPIIACAAVRVLSDTGIDPLKARLAPDGSLASDNNGWLVQDLLEHRANLTAPNIWRVLLTEPRRLQSLLAEHVADAFEVRATAEVGYSEVTAFWLLDVALTNLLGVPFDRYLQAKVVAATGERIWFAPDRELLDMPYEALATCTVAELSGRAPLGHAVTKRTRSLASTWMGPYGTLTGVLTWYRHLADFLAGGSDPEGLFPDRTLLKSAFAEPSNDRSSYRLGFQVRSRTGAVGHHAAGGSLGAWLDPRDGVAWVTLTDSFHLDSDARDADLESIDAHARALIAVHAHR